MLEKKKNERILVQLQNAHATFSLVQESNVIEERINNKKEKKTERGMNYFTFF